MTRDEYLAMLDTEPATPTQRGAVMRECDRLGLADRAERLAILAALLDLDALGSTANLTMGQAGKLVNLLQSTQNRGDLPEITTATGADDGGQLGDHTDDAGPDDGQGDDGSGGMSIAEAIHRIILMFALAVYGKDLHAESAHIGLNIQRLRATECPPAQGRN